MNTDPSDSTAVARALNILELVGGNKDGLTNAQISQTLKIPKSSASYILRTLERRGYLRRDPLNQRYRIGLKVAGLAHGMFEFTDLRQAASPILRQLVQRSHLTAHLAIFDRGRAVYIDRAEEPGFLRINTWIGRDLNVHATAVGKILLAFRNETEIRTILEQQGMQAKTPKTLTEIGDYLDELKAVRSRGYAQDDEENNLGVRCVAAPVWDTADSVLAAVGLTGATSQFPRESIPEFAALAVRGAQIISHHLGHLQRE